MYAESAATLERLAILKAWAQVYVTAVRQSRGDGRQAEVQEGQSKGEIRVLITKNTFLAYVDVTSICGESLLSLVRPELTALIIHWLNALRDAALLALPPEFSSQLPKNGGAFFTQQTAHSCRVYYRSVRSLKTRVSSK